MNAGEQVESIVFTGELDQSSWMLMFVSSWNLRSVEFISVENDACEKQNITDELDSSRWMLMFVSSGQCTVSWIRQSGLWTDENLSVSWIRQGE